MNQHTDEDRPACKPWWRNCGAEADPEMLAIDKMEEGIAPLAASESRIRELVSTLEMCHHKADRWVHNIIEAIGSGQTTKGLGTRIVGKSHPVEHVWQEAFDALSAWCAGCPSALLDGRVGSVPASEILASVGERSPLKEWQVHRVAERTHSFIRWPRSSDDILTHYRWILEAGSGYESEHRSTCPGYFKDHEDFWSATVGTEIHNTIDSKEEEISLALAIDLLMPCHWNFAENLEIVLQAIGGNLRPSKPLFACSMNARCTPIRGQMKIVSNSLRAFYKDSGFDGTIDRDILLLLGEASPTSRWLAASLDKTIRLQLDL